MYVNSLVNSSQGKSGWFKNKTLRSIFSIFVLRGGNIGIQLLIIPVSINYVSASSYGLWLTVSSMIAWLSIMDIGLSAGLRNKLTEAITSQDYNLAKSYVSTTYALLFFMALGGFVICGGLIFFLDWKNVLSIPPDLSYGKFQLLLCIVAISFFISFLLKPIASIAYALHKPEIEYLILFLANFINLFVIWLVIRVSPSGNLIILSSLFCFTPVMVTFFLSIILYRKKFSLYKPSLRFVDFKYAAALTRLSVKFFIIQISATVVFTTNNFIISHYFGNSDVTKYNIVSKYFNVLIILQSMILVPFWTYFTEAYIHTDSIKMRYVMSRLFKMTFLFIIGCVCMIFISGFVYRIWLGNVIEIPFSLTIFVGMFTALSLVASIFSTFLNGTGRIKLQMYTSLVPSLLHIPLVILMITVFNFQITGVIAVSSFWLLITLPLRYFQYWKIVNFVGHSDKQSSIWFS